MNHISVIHPKFLGIFIVQNLGTEDVFFGTSSSDPGHLRSHGVVIKAGTTFRIKLNSKKNVFLLSNTLQDIRLGIF